MKFYPGIILLLTLLSRGAFAQNAGGDTAVCSGNYRIQFRGTPAGGVWSGDSITPGGSFKPDSSFLPQRFVTLTYTLPNGSSAIKVVTVKGTPRVRITTPNQPLCANADPLQITYTPNLAPPQGTWTGLGVGPTGLFVPNRALLGSNLLTYLVDTNGCVGRAQIRITVNDYPNVTAGPDLRLCANDDPQLLAGGTPAGGTYDGPGVAGGIFSPAPALVGINRIRYTSPPNAFGCRNTNFLFVTVNPVPTVKAGNDTTVCANTPAFNLQNATPANGVWTPPAKVSSNGRFTPSNALSGFNQLFYTVSNSVTGCKAADTIVINVISIPTGTLIDAGRDTSICANTACFSFTRARPAGGHWYNANRTLGDSIGITDSSTGRFCPSPLIAGTQIVRYIVRNGVCKATDSLRVNIRPLPRANAGVDFNACSGNSGVQIGDAPLPELPPGLRYKYKWTGSDGILGFDRGEDTISNPIVDFVNGTTDSIVREYYLQVTRLETGQPSCFNIDTVRVVIYPKPIARTIPPLRFRGCEGDSILLRAETRKGLLYQWLNQTTLLTPAPSDSDSVYVATTTGRYRLIVVRNVEVRGGTCADTSSGDSVFIKDKVKPTILGFPNYCRNRTDTLTVDTVDTQNFAYQWLRQEILTDSTTGPYQIIIGARDTVYHAGRVGLYSIVLADNRFGIICMDTSEAVRVDSIRTPFVNLVRRSSDSTFTVCTGQLPVQLLAPTIPGQPDVFRYLWQDSTTSLFNVIDTVGTYFLTVYNRCGSATDTLRVTQIRPTPVFSILDVASKDTVVCKGIELNLSVPAAGDRYYYWSVFELNDDSTKTLIYAPRDPQNANNPLPQDAINFPWVNNLVPPDTVNRYLVQVRSQSPRDSRDYCQYTDSAIISVVECEPVVYIPTAFTPQGDNINDQWTLAVYSVRNISVQVYNRWGEQVYSYKATNTDPLTFREGLIQNAWDGTYEGKALPSSAYQYVITYSGIKPGTGETQEIQFKRTGTVTLLR